MEQYFISRTPNKDGNFEIHLSDCFKPYSNCIYLGEFSSCKKALAYAKQYFEPVVFCKICLPQCNDEPPIPYTPNKDLFEDFILQKK